ncbi:metal ABC transporter permease [Granulicatella seriolae]|uniref:Metal ABC transporter permease n=1 Tax=Granulicatella seriolae TaxID=2967226 RepID=A0ABT1WLI3_9LACT|nr:metal ABC transporter permease [Granulicatella seriolae]
MTTMQMEVIILAVLFSLSCSLVGVFLVLKRMAMMSDAISHTVLLGIVLGYLVTKDLTSPLLFIGAVVMGLLTVYFVEVIKNTKLLSEESSIGVVFPLLFSIAVIIISKFLGNTHIDTDMVLLGELVFAPLNRVEILGLSVPESLLPSLIILLINTLVIALFYKELTISSFDIVLATTLGFSPILLNYLLMTLVSITAVTTFNAVGVIVMIAFMVGPPITAQLLTNRLLPLIAVSCLFAIWNVISGYLLARHFDISIAGSMALMTGISYLLVFAFNTQKNVWQQKVIVSKQ